MASFLDRDHIDHDRHSFRMLEKVFVQKILKFLRANYADVFCWKTHDMFHAGIPDIIGCWRGIFFGIEVKVKGGKVEKIQTYVIEQIKSSGGIAGVAWTIEEVKEIMHQVLRKSLN